MPSIFRLISIDAIALQASASRMALAFSVGDQRRVLM
jgi:hypothetical protein